MRAAMIIAWAAILLTIGVCTIHRAVDAAMETKVEVQTALEQAGL